MKTENNLSDLFDYKLDCRTRTLFLTKTGDDNDATVMERFLMGLHVLDSTAGNKPIHISMNHEGGDENCNMAMYDAIKSAKSEVIVTVYGNAASMGAWVLQAADHRIMMPSSRMMIHIGENSAPSDHVRNNIALLEAFKRDIVYFEDILLARIREKHPKYTRQKLVKLIDFNTYLWPEEALELGLIDQIGLTS